MAVSSPTSRCSMTDCLSSKMNSIGSSSVTMCFRDVELMWSIIAASVVDFPDPVAPAMSTMPLGASAMRRTVSGRWSWAKVRIADFTRRSAMT